MERKRRSPATAIVPVGQLERERSCARGLARTASFSGQRKFLFCACVAWLLGSAPAPAQTTLEDLVAAVVAIKTFINPDARTTETLGREREGSGIVIDEDGLVLTIGYLMVEAHAAQVTTNAGRAVPANVVGYDHETGFGLLRTIEPLKLKPLGFGRSGAVQEGDPALVASFGGPPMVAAVRVVSKRAFAGSWEYLLDQALYHRAAAPDLERRRADLARGQADRRRLADRRRRDRRHRQEARQHVRADRPVAADPRRPDRRRPHVRTGEAVARGQRARTPAAACWSHASPPAARPRRPASSAATLIVGVNGEATKTMAEFYRKVWALGTAGATIPLDVEQGGAKRRIEIKSMNRLDHLKLKSTF